MSAFLKVDNLEKYYGSAENITKAIDRISFEINEGEFVGIMGESGLIYLELWTRLRQGMCFLKEKISVK